jgi:hypothetical protein
MKVSERGACDPETITRSEILGPAVRPGTLSRRSKERTLRSRAKHCACSGSPLGVNGTRSASAAAR